MNDIQNSLFETMKAFSDNAKNSSDSALVKEGVITEVLDAGLGEYSLEFMENTFTVYANNQNITYSVGDNVYFTIPDGDFNKNKIILGLVNPSIDTFVDNTYESSRYYDVSDNLIDAHFGDSSGIIKMSSYEITNVVNQDITEFTSISFAKILKGYCNEDRTFSFGFTVKTDMEPAQRTGGNYGVSLNIPLVVNAAAGQGETEVVWKTYTLDVSNMLGTPYRYDAWSPQVVYFTLDEQYSISNDYVPTLSYFCYGFNQNPDKADIKDIWIKDISFKAVDILTEDETTGYSLGLKASEGIYFSENYRTTKTIVPTLRVNGKKTTLKTDLSEVYWFIENSSVKADSDYYCSYGGFGWECLNEKTGVVYNDDGTRSFNWVTSIFQLDVKQQDIGESARFKCVIVYKNKIVSNIITLINLDIDRSLILKTTEGNNTFIKDTGYVHLSTIVYIDGVTDKEEYRNSVIYSWLRYNKNGSFIADSDSFFEKVRFNEINEDGKYESEIMFPVNAIEDFNIIQCSAIYIDSNLQKQIVGTKEIKISTSTNFDYTLTIDGDDVIYKYDSNGDSPAGAAYDGPSTSKVINISPLTFTIRKPDGTELTREEYSYIKYTWVVPKTSLFIVSGATREDDDNYYFEGYDNYHNSKLSYRIANRYNVSKAKQSIKLIAELQDNILQTTANIDFMKEGENGSNGTAYAARLVAGGLTSDTSVPYGTPNAQGVTQKLKFLYNINNSTLYFYDIDSNTLIDWNEEKRRIYPHVYRDSELLAYEQDYSVVYKMFDSRTTEPCFDITDNIDSTGGILLELSETPEMNKIYCNILEAQITVTNGNTSISRSHEIIYAYYPIEISIINTEMEMIPSMDGGFAEVMYASDGTNPAWDQTSPFMVIDNSLDINNQDFMSKYFNVTWDCSNHLNIKPIKKEDDTIIPDRVNIKPDNKYDNGDSKNYVKSTLIFNNSKETEINAEIQGLERDNTRCESNIAAAALNKQYLQNFAEAYQGDVWEVGLDNIKELLDKQTSAVYQLENPLLSSIVEIDDYFAMQREYGSVDIYNICESTILEISNLQTELEKAVVKIKQLNGSEGYDFEDLISLANYKISWDEEIKQTYKDSLGLDIVLNLEILILNINTQIDEYQNRYEALRYLNGGESYLTIYRQIIDGINTMCNQIQDDAYSRFIGIKQKVLIYLDRFNNYTSIKDLKFLISSMYNNALSTVFDLNNYQLTVNEVTLNELDNIINTNQLKIDNNNRTITDLQNIKQTKNHQIVHIRPIVMYFNRYEKSNLNAWDGNKIETGDDSYLLAPQVGAGRKESDNSFTGIVIGQRNIDNGGSIIGQTGLFGYSKGKQSIFLNAEDGSSTFGVSDQGQVIIDPSSNRALIKSGNYSTSGKTGMQIDLSTPEIRFGSGNFIVDSTGYITAKGGGEIAGWKIGDTELYSNQSKSNGRITLDSSSYGKIYSHNHSSLIDTTNGFYLAYDGFSLGSKFKVTNEGVMYIGTGATTQASYGKYWTIDGGTNSYIAYNATGFNCSNLDTDSPSIGGSANSVYIGTDGIRLGTKFAVDADGNLAATSGTFKGKINASTISGSTISGSTITSINDSDNSTIEITGGQINIKQGTTLVSSICAFYSSVFGDNVVRFFKSSGSPVAIAVNKIFVSELECYGNHIDLTNGLNGKDYDVRITGSNQEFHFYKQGGVYTTLRAGDIYSNGSPLVSQTWVTNNCLTRSEWGPWEANYRQEIANIWAAIGSKADAGHTHG